MVQTPVIVQAKPFSFVNTTDAVVTLDTPPTAGNCLIAVGKENTANALTYPAGYADVTSSPYNGGVGREVFCCYKVAGVGESSSFTLHTAATANKEFELYEVSGLGAIPAIDVVPLTASSTTGVSRAMATTGTLAQAKNLALLALDTSLSNGGEVSVTAGYTFRDGASTSLVALADQITNATTALVPTVTWTTSRLNFGFQVIFKAAVDVPAAPVISTPTAAQVLTSAAFNVTGTAEAGSTVTLYKAADNSVMGSAVATGGNWSIALAGQTTASYTVYAKATNNGGTGVASANRSYSVSLTSPGTIGDTLTYSMNRLAGTLVGNRPTLAATGAANLWAGTTGLGLVGALNVKAGNTLPNYKALPGVLNQLAGTSGLAAPAAAAQILA